MDIRKDVFKVRNISDDRLEGKGTVEVTATDLVYVDSRTNEKWQWPCEFLRRYGFEGKIFTFETGRRCPGGSRLYALESEHGNEISKAINEISRASTGSSSPATTAMTRPTSTFSNVSISELEPQEQKQATYYAEVSIMPQRPLGPISFKAPADSNNPDADRDGDGGVVYAPLDFNAISAVTKMRDTHRDIGNFEALLERHDVRNPETHKCKKTDTAAVATGSSSPATMSETPPSSTTSEAHPIHDIDTSPNIPRRLYESPREFSGEEKSRSDAGPLVSSPAVLAETPSTSMTAPASTSISSGATPISHGGTTENNYPTLLSSQSSSTPEAESMAHGSTPGPQPKSASSDTSHSDSTHLTDW